MANYRSWKVAVAVTCGALPVAAHSKLEVTPYVSVGAQYDDNVFRYEDSDEAELVRGDRKMSDTAMRYEAGLASNYTFGLQNFVFNASGNKSEYEHFEELDYEGYNVNGALNWQIGSLLKGTLEGSDRRELQNFDDTSSTIDSDERGLRDETDGSLTVNIKLLQDYELRPKAGLNRVRYSRDSARQQDLDEENFALALSYIGRGTMSIGIEGVLKQGDFIRRDDAAIAGAVQEYDETTIQLIGRYSPTAVTQFNYTVGSTRRDNKGTDVKDDTALVGSLNVSRSISVKTVVYAGLYRAVSSAEREGESTVISSGLNAGGNWAATTFISVNGNAYYRVDDFQDSVLSDNDRKDKVKGFKLAAVYAPREWIAITPDIGWEDRKSDFSTEEYDAFQAGLTLKLQFPFR